ncbi:MAG: acyl-ACP--UDP-N-acetylglucosamine O-acyltransferase [Verrucomicrobiota bacterium]|jgi:UDP-N-acetylglucosamine acyltransferase
MIHPTAVIHPRAQVASGCEIGPYCVIGEHVMLGEECKLHSHVVIDGHAELGRRNELFPFAALGLRTQDLKWKGGVTHLRVGDGNIFREGVTVHSATGDGDATVIGSNNVLLANVHVAHDCQLGNNIVMSSFAGLAGHVVVEDNVVLGGYVAVHQFCRLGKLSMVGGCSKLRQDLAPFMLADGSPAEMHTINKVGLERYGVPEASIAALKQAYKILFREGLTITNALVKIESELPVGPEITHLLQFIRASERGINR